MASIRDDDGRNFCEDRLKDLLSHQLFEVSRDKNYLSKIQIQAEL